MTNIAKSEFKKLAEFVEKECKNARASTLNEALKLLEEVYQELYIQSYYDPDSQAIQEFCIPLEEKMSQANKILRFKK
jgi:hypothetical protein